MSIWALSTIAISSLPLLWVCLFPSPPWGTIMCARLARRMPFLMRPAERLFHSAFTTEKAEILCHPKCPTEFITRLTHSKRKIRSGLTVGYQICENEHATPEALEFCYRRMVPAHDRYLLTDIVKHPNTGAETLRSIWGKEGGLESMMGGRLVDVCRHLIVHPNAPTEWLQEAASHSDVFARYTAAGNLSMPPETLVLLACDSDADVREAAARSLASIREQASHGPLDS